MEGQNLLRMVKGRVYNAELRAELLQSGLRRIGGMLWVSKETATKYELIIDNQESKLVTGVDIIDDKHREHVGVAPEPPAEAEPMPSVQVNLNLHHRTVTSLMRHLDVADYFYYQMDCWNDEIARGTIRGSQLKELFKRDLILWDNFLFLPDPTATGRYLFSVFRKGKAASTHAWLALPDQVQYYVPAEATEESVYESLQCGLDFHAWEFQNFDTPAAAGQFAIRMLNNSDTTYAQTIRRLLGKEEGRISRNDFYRNADNVMCRIDVIEDEQGLHFYDVPVLPTVADCIDSLLAPYIRQRALNP